MDSGKYAIGIDFGSNSARALIIDVATGKELGKGVCEYPGGDHGVFTDPQNHHLARQCAGSYCHSLKETVTTALEEAAGKPGFSPEKIIGIGVDTTGSTPIPVTEDMTPLSFLDKFKDNLNAKAWMWKDHTSMEEAAAITEIAEKMRPQYLKKCGGVYSSEWFFAKLWHCLKVDPEVFNAAYTWIEFCDYIPAVLAGIKHPDEVKRGICAAGHKAMYSEDWNGLPDEEFLNALDPELGKLRSRLYEKAYPADEIAGNLCEKWAEMLGLPAGIPIAVGAFDAHLGAVGSGVGHGSLVKIIGTSTCDIMVSPSSHKLPDIPGVCGIVDGSVIPGSYGIEAGQSAVGDIFNWFATKVCLGHHEIFKGLTEEAEKLRPGQSGLLALDWNNGNRCILVDPKLTGMVLGLTLHSSQAEIYRALIEGTAFGAKKIIDRLEEYGIHIEDIINCGGIAEKNPLFMQIYADVLNRKMRITGSGEACALGSAIFGAVAGGGYPSVEAAQEKICTCKDVEYLPDPENVAIYQELFELYSELHDSFGIKETSFDHSGIMKKLLSISHKVRK